MIIRGAELKQIFRFSHIYSKRVKFFAKKIRKINTLFRTRAGVVTCLTHV